MQHLGDIGHHLEYLLLFLRLLKVSSEGQTSSEYIPPVIQHAHGSNMTNVIRIEEECHVKDMPYKIDMYEVRP